MEWNSETFSKIALNAPTLKLQTSGTKLIYKVTVITVIILSGLYSLLMACSSLIAKNLFVDVCTYKQI